MLGFMEKANPQAQLKEVQAPDAPRGSFDQAPPILQMEAINRALVVYFGSRQWLRVRRVQQPGIG